MRRRVAATASVKDQLKRGRRALRLLNAILSPKLAADPELLAAWNNVRRVKPTSGTSQGPVTAAPAGGKVALKGRLKPLGVSRHHPSRPSRAKSEGQQAREDTPHQHTY